MEPEFTFKLVDIVYSPKHGHEVCVMQLAGKNTFPKFTPQEILSNPRAMCGLSPFDASTITELNHRINERKKNHTILEIDRNGTIVLKDSSGKVRRYSERYLSSSRELLNSMRGEDAHDLGYRVGFRDGLEVKNFKKQASKSFKSKVLKLIPGLSSKKK